MREKATFHVEANVDSLSNGSEITAISVLFDVIPVEVVVVGGGCDVTATTTTTNATTNAAAAVAEVVSLFCC